MTFTNMDFAINVSRVSIILDCSFWSQTTFKLLMNAPTNIIIELGNKSWDCLMSVGTQTKMTSK